MKPTWPIKAYKNIDFLVSPAARTIRILSEMLEPLERFKKFRVKNTVVFFGSARALPLKTAEANLRKAKGLLKTKNKKVATITAMLEKAEYELRLAKYYDQAEQLAAKLTYWFQSLKSQGTNFAICSGGGPGIMEAANKGAYKAKGLSVGLNISLPMEQNPNPYQTRDLAFEFHYFFIRKFWFFYLAKALVVFPGGFGTMDEFFELLTLVQTKKTTKPMPIVLFGGDYWNDVMNFDKLVKWNTISPEDLKLFKIIDDVDTAFEFLKENITKHYLRGK